MKFDRFLTPLQFVGARLNGRIRATMAIKRDLEIQFFPPFHYRDQYTRLLRTGKEGNAVFRRKTRPHLPYTSILYMLLKKK